MPDINLGSASFSLALNATEFAQNMTAVGARVANSAGFINKNFTSIGTATQGVSDKIGNFSRGLDRMTRGIRGIAPELAHAKEQVYRYQDSIRSLNELMAIQRTRIAQKAEIEQKNLDIIEKTRQVIDDLKGRIRLLSNEYQAQLTIHQDMIRAGTHTQQELETQAEIVKLLGNEVKKLTNEEKAAQRVHDMAEKRQGRLTMERERAEHQLKRLQHSESRYTSLLGMAKERIATVAEKLENRRKRQEAARASIERLNAAEQRSGGLMAWLSGLFGRGSSSTNQFNASIQRTTSITGTLNNALLRTGSMFRDILTISIGSFVGNVLGNLVSGTQGVITTALDAYKSYEMLGMSLTALAARQAVAEGKFKNLADAQDYAGKQSKALLDWMSKLAIQSPFSVDDISGAFRLGNALGFTAAQTQNLIQKTVDWAAATGGTGESITSVIRAMGQMHNTGHVTLEDLNQMTDAGLGARDVLRKEFAPEILKSKKSLEDLISAGLLPADRAINALSRSMGKDFGRSPGFEQAYKTIDQISASGRIAGEHLDALESHGINAGKILSEHFAPMIQSTGKTLDQLVKEGLIPAGEASKILGDAINNQLGGGADKAGSSMTGLLASIGDLKNTALREFLTSTFQAVQPVITSLVSVLTNPSTIASIQAFGQLIGQGVGQAMNWLANVAVPSAIHAFQTFGPMVMEAISYLAAIAQEAYIWGYNIGEMFAQGMSDTLDSILSIVNWIGETLTAWLAPGSPPKILPDIDDWGRETMQVYLEAMAEADPRAAIEKIHRKVRAELNERGGGFATRQMLDYQRAIFRSAEATDALRRAQGELDTITKQFDARLTPLKQKLDALRGKQDDRESGRELARLQMMLDKGAVTGGDARKVQDRIDEILTEREIARIEKEKQAALDAQESKISAAERAAIAAAKELEVLEKLLLIAQQQEDAAQKEKETEEEKAKRDADAKERYEFNKASTVEQIDLLKQKQAQEQAGTAEWYALQEQIEAKEAQLKREQEKADKAGDTADKEADRAAKEAERLHEAQYRARLAAASSEEERLAIMQEEQARYAEGSLEYLQMQDDIEKQKDKVAKTTGKASEAEFDHALAMADSANKVQMLKERLEQLDPASAEYAKRQEQLLKATQAQEKADQKLLDAQFESQLAGKSREEQIVMLKDKLGTLNEGTLEYEKTLKRLNGLEGAEAREGIGGKGKGGPKGKLKPGAIGSGGPLDELKTNVTETTKTVTENIDKIKGAFTNIGDKVAKVREKFAPFFDFLKENSEIIVYILQKLAMSAAIAVAVSQVVEPLQEFVMGIKSFLTWGNLFWLTITALGYAWKTNLGGLRDIVSDVWTKIQPQLESISKLFETIKGSFEQFGLSGGFEMLKALGPIIFDNIVIIGQTVFNGILTWITPFLNGLTELINKAVIWAQQGGLEKLFNEIVTSISNFFSGDTAKGSIITGILGMIGGLTTVLQTLFVELFKNSDMIANSASELWNGFLRWSSDNLPIIFEGLGAALGTAFLGLLKVAGPLIQGAFKAKLDFLAWFLPLIPLAISALFDIVLALIAWAKTDGILMLGNMFGDLLNALGKMLPSLGLNLGRALGQMMSKLFLTLVAVQQYVNSADFQKNMADLWNNKIWPGIKTFSAGFVGFFIGFVTGLLYGLADPIINAMRVALLGAQNGLNDTINGMLQPILDTLKGWLPWLTDMMMGWPGTIFQMISPTWYNIGENILQTLISSIELGPTAVIEAFINLFDSALRSLKDFLGIASPSTVFMEIGNALIQGLIDGILALQAALNTLITGMLDTILDFFGTNRDEVLLVWTTLRDRTLEFAQHIWDGLVGSAGWVTKLVADVTTFFLNLLGFITGDAGSFTKLKQSAIQIANDLWQGLVGTAGWITKLVDLADQLFDNLLGWITGDSGSWTTLKQNALSIGQQFWDGLVGTAGWVTKLVDGAKSLFSNLLGAITGPEGSITKLGADIATIGKNIWNGLVGPEGYISKLVLDFPAKVMTFISAAKGTLQGFADWISDGVSGLAKSVYDGAIELGRSLLQAVTDFISRNIYRLKNYVKDALQSFINNLIAAVTGQGEEGEPSAPGYALGTQYATGGEAIVGEEGMETVILPRGSQVLNSSRTMDRLNAAFNAMGDRILAQLNTTLQGFAEMQSGSAPQTVNNITQTIERHDHWNLTVNTRATVATVVEDYTTMRAMAGGR